MLFLRVVCLREPVDAFSFLQGSPVFLPCLPVKRNRYIPRTERLSASTSGNLSRCQSALTADGLATVDSSSNPAHGPWKSSMSSGLSFRARFRVSLVSFISMIDSSMNRKYSLYSNYSTVTIFSCTVPHISFLSGQILLLSATYSSVSQLLSHSQ